MAVAPVFNYATEGQTISLVLGPDRTPMEAAVGPKHEGGDGHWYCAIHRVGCQHNMAMGSHNDEPGSHVWVWICHEHGPEVP